MRTRAFVVAKVGENALLRGERASACGGCAGKAACGTLGSWNNTRHIEMLAANPLRAQVGDQVEVEVPDRSMLRASFRLYALPLLVFLCVGGLAFLLAPTWGMDPDVTAALSGILGMAACYRWIAANDHMDRKEMARIVAILESASSGSENARFSSHPPT